MSSKSLIGAQASQWGTEESVSSADSDISTQTSPSTHIDPLLHPDICVKGINLYPVPASRCQYGLEASEEAPERMSVPQAPELAC
ncbi:hypothetical protein ACOMHN_011629 [Nucella lapillus]